MSMLRILIPAALAICACAADAAEVRIVPQDSGVKVRLRGISAVSADIAWASGREGTVLRTVDGGKHWQAMKVPGAEELDFRDVEGFDGDTAVVLSIGPGEASRIYRTEDGGGTWKLVLRNLHPKGFFDCMAFDGERGWMLGDPVGKRFQVYHTENAGRSWKLSVHGPEAVPGEAAFAASGTCIAAHDGQVFAVSGGAKPSLHVLSDGTRWHRYAGLPGEAATESAGFFSVAFADAPLLVGGDYKGEQSPGRSAQLIEADITTTHQQKTIDGAVGRKGNDIVSPLRLTGGKTERTKMLADLPPPRGYRSGLACLAGGADCIAVGPSGSDRWDGKAWAPVDETGYDAIDLSGRAGWVSGDAGRIARIEIGD